MSNSIPLKLITTYGIIGIALCAVYLFALRWNIRLYCNYMALWKALLLHLLRLVAIGTAFTLCARQGALPLLLSFGGFVGMRTIALW